MVAVRKVMGGNPRKGVLFEGPPGTGKTYMAKAMAHEAGVPFLFVSSTAFQSQYYGATGRKIRVTKVPFSASAKALINAQPQGFVKLLSDPATGVILGGSIVGRHAAELISVIALAVTCNLKVTDILESVLVHPALSEALADAAE